jgi:hypothetical protein
MRGGSVLRVTGYLYLFHITASGTLTGTGTQAIGSFCCGHVILILTEDFAVDLGKFCAGERHPSHVFEQ